MINRVFNNRLKRDLVAEIVQAALFGIDRPGELVFIAVRLYFQIALRVLQFVSNGDQLMPAADADAEQAGKRIDHLDSLGVFTLFAHPGDRVQGVVQKMRIDLGLQGTQLRFPQIDFFLANRFHQLLHFEHEVTERDGEMADFPYGDLRRIIVKPVGVLFKLRHGVFQIPKRMGEHGTHDRADQECCQEYQSSENQENRSELPQTFGQKFLQKTDTDQPPLAVAQGLDGIDHQPFHIASVFQRGDSNRVLCFEIGIDQLLLRMIDDVPVRVHQIAVSAPADAAVADVGGDIAAADVQSDPALAAFLLQVQTGDHGDDPGIYILKKGHNVRRGDISVRLGKKALQIQREIDAVRPGSRRRTEIAVAVGKISRRIIGRHRDDIRTGAEKDIKEVCPPLFRVGHFLLQGAHHGVDFREIVVDGAADLGYGAEAVRPGGSDELLLVSPRKEKNRAGQNKEHNGQIRERKKTAHANTAIFHTVSSVWRILAGLVPWYFLKQ